MSHDITIMMTSLGSQNIKVGHTQKNYVIVYATDYTISYIHVHTVQVSIIQYSAIYIYIYI